MSILGRFFARFFTRRPRIAPDCARKIERAQFVHAVARMVREHRLCPEHQARVNAYAADLWAENVMKRRSCIGIETLIREHCELLAGFQTNDQPAPNIPPQVTPIETARLLKRAKGWRQPTGGAAA